MLDKSQLKPGSESRNISATDIKKFDALAESWWDPKGKYRTALGFNATRVEYIEACIRKHFHPTGVADSLFHDLEVLEVGSGGGLICEPLAKRGASVTGIDASGVSIEVAKRHAEKMGLDIDYRHCLVEDWVKKDFAYDIVINAEVVEHVPDQQALIAQCASMVRPGGLLILATLNRTVKSYIVAIVGAEYVMRYLPVGTHEWRKFVTPDELDSWAGKEFSRKGAMGFSLNPITGKWRQSPSLDVNYMSCYKKE